MANAAYRNKDGMALLLLDWTKKRSTVLHQTASARLSNVFRSLLLWSIRSKAFYSHIYFAIADHCGHSTERRQNAGFAQGCRRSPYLFIVVTTVMLHDAIDSLALETEPEHVVTKGVLYAGGTLLVSRHVAQLQSMLGTTVLEGQKYGMDMNWKKP